MEISSLAVNLWISKLMNEVIKEDFPQKEKIS